MSPNTLNKHESKRLPWKLIWMYIYIYIYVYVCVCVCVCTLRSTCIFRLCQQRNNAVNTTKKHGLSKSLVVSEFIYIHACTKNIDK
jgi:hypothetical protein